MTEKMPTSTDPETIKRINEEGWEGNAAVLIGKKEDMPRMLERLESEGNTEDLGTYIKLHKEILLPITEVDSSEQQTVLVGMKGQGIMLDYERLFYIDKEGNYCRVNIYADKIAELLEKLAYISKEESNWAGKQEKIIKEIEKILENLGFDLSRDNKFNYNFSSISRMASVYKEKIKKK